MNSKKLTAILCDDEPSIIEDLKNAFEWEQAGIELIGTAQNGRNALDLIFEYKPDLCIIDIKMPQMTGTDVLSHARKAGIDTDFIILSGYNDFAYAKDAIRYGASAYLLKPLNISELHDEVYRICVKRSRDGFGTMNKAYQKQLSQSFLRNLLEGKIIEQGSLDSMLRNADVKLSDTACYVMVLSFEELPDTQTDFSYDSMLHILNKSFEQEQHVFFGYSKTQLIGIFNLSSEIDMLKAERIQQLLKDAGHPLPLIGIGDHVQTLIQCAYSYSRALTAMTYRLYNENQMIFTSSMICTVPPAFRLSDIDYLPLVQFIVKKELDSIRGYCDDFMQKLLYVKMPAPNYVYSSCYALYHMIEQEFSHYSHEEIASVTSPQDLYHCRSLKKIRDWLVSSFIQLSQYIDAVYGYASSKYTSDKLADAGDEIISAAVKYIHDHVTDNIRIEDIAREVHLSASYFAIYFKSHTNVNLRDHLLKEKMEYARRCLLNPETSVTDIAYQLGYRDYRSFSRAFKNIHGITPSDFQSKHTH